MAPGVVNLQVAQSVGCVAAVLTGVLLDDIVDLHVASQMGRLCGLIRTLCTFEKSPCLVGSHMPAKSCFRFISFVTFGAGIGFLIGMPQHVSLQVVLAPTGMWAEGAFKWLYSLMDPNVFLELRVCSNEHFITVRALVASSTYFALHFVFGRGLIPSIDV